MGRSLRAKDADLFMHAVRFAAPQALSVSPAHDATSLTKLAEARPVDAGDSLGLTLWTTACLSLAQRTRSSTSCNVLIGTAVQPWFPRSPLLINAMNENLITLLSSVTMVGPTLSAC